MVASLIVFFIVIVLELLQGTSFWIFLLTPSEHFKLIFCFVLLHSSTWQQLNYQNQFHAFIEVFRILKSSGVAWGGALHNINYIN